jgi:SAM-dependent methyltransferase
MNRFLFGVARAVTETFTLPEPILEVGSYQVEGQDPELNLRRLFPGRDYTGLDLRAGPGVDCVADVENLPKPADSVGTVIAMNTFEHVRCFWRGFAEVRRVLRPDGVFLLSCPFYFHVHNYPHDYWRFTPEALEALLEDYPSRIIGWHGARQRPANVWAIAFGPARPAITPEQFARHRTLVQKYAYQPEDSCTRRWRYRLASFFCGRGPFDTYLDRNQWDAHCQNTKRARTTAVA